MADRRRYSFVLYTAIAVAAAATFGVYQVLEDAKKDGIVATQPVVTVARDLPEGTQIALADLTVGEWPVPTVPAGAFAAPDSLVGRVTRIAVFKGEPLVPGRLAPEGTGPGLEVKITPGKRAAAIRINDVSGVSGLIQPNSRVDVLVTLNDERGEPGQVSKIFMENMRVLSVGPTVERDANGQPIPAATAALEVTPEEAERLAAAVSQGSLQLVLRGYGDPEAANTDGARARDVLGFRPAPAPAPRPSAPARRVTRPTPAPPPAPAPAPAVTPPAPPRQHTVEVIRAAARTEQKFDTTANRPPR